MTLKEKFKLPIDAHNKINNYVAEQSEKIACDFAIGFAEWCTKYRDKNRNVNGEMLHAKSKYDETYLTKELLEMYKKEKGL